MNSKLEISLDKTIGLLKQHQDKNISKIELLSASDKNADRLLLIILQDKNYYFTIQIKSSLAGNAVINSLKSKLPALRSKLIIADYISPKVEEFFYQNQISFIDLRGIIFLNQNSLYIKIRHNLQPLEHKAHGYAFQKAGVKLLLYIIMQPNLLNQSFRNISLAAEVSTGTISKVFKDLKNKGFLSHRNSKRFIRNRKDLINKWVYAYVTKLRPICFIGNYKSSQNMKNQLPLNTYFSGEIAAELLDINYKGQVYTLYTGLPELEIVKKVHLIPFDQGNIELFKIFWNQNTLTTNNDLTAPILIVYADLMLSDSSRNHEIAEELYEKYLLNII